MLMAQPIRVPSRSRLPPSRQAERTGAQFASWYEIFPRSMSDDERRHGTFDDVIAPSAAHPRHGLRRALFPADPSDRPQEPQGPQQRADAPAPDDPGSPYAIGSQEGGHDAIHPHSARSTISARLRDAPPRTGSNSRSTSPSSARPTIPGCRSIRTGLPGGRTARIKYAENPPKKYEDIVNVDFYAPAPSRISGSRLRDVVLYWAEQGVRIFRVDNPHTKPFPFWEWMIADVRATLPRRDLPRGSFHAAEDDVPAGKDRLLAVLYLLHLAQQKAGIARLSASN